MGWKRYENEEPGCFSITSKQNKKGCYLCETDKEMIDSRVRKELGVKKALQAKVRKDIIAMTQILDIDDIDNIDFGVASSGDGSELIDADEVVTTGVV